MVPRLLAAIALCLLVRAAPAEVSLATLRPHHPRLIVLDSDLEALRKLIAANPNARGVYKQLLASAARMQNEPPAKHVLIGPRLLDQSRLALDRIYTLALLYRLDRQPRYLERAVKELRAVAAFPDWNPSHFLDTAEMTHAVAIGYDWLYADLSPADRQLLRGAIVRLGIDPALKLHEDRAWWTNSPYNWNQVCNGGIAIGALAVGEDEPARAARMLRYAVETVPFAMASYAPDGGWSEGPAYWNYATSYNVYFLAALESALGTDFNLSKSPGFDRAGDFIVDATGPTGRTFNYADAHDEIESTPVLFWLARRFHQPVFPNQLWALVGSGAFNLIWYPDESASPVKPDAPAARVYEGVQVVFLRTSPKDPGALWMAVKGGDNQANHSHLDLGTFVLEALGVRWAVDLGSDDYNLPQYFGPLRFTYYRLRTESHNTVLIDGENQDAKAAAPITARALDGDSPSVTIDLSAAYPGRLLKHTREVSTPGRAAVAIRDRIEAVRPVEALWGMVTAAAVAIEPGGRQAVLTLDGKRLLAKIAGPVDARFDIVSTQPAPPQMQNLGTRKLVVRLPAKVQSLDLTVTLTPRP